MVVQIYTGTLAANKQCPVSPPPSEPPTARGLKARSPRSTLAHVSKCVEECSLGERGRPLPEPRAVVGLAWAEGFPLWLGLVSAKVEWRVKSRAQLSSSFPSGCILNIPGKN